MPIPTRPTGSSIFSDIASAGTGFASGLKAEQERKRQEALQAALQKFDMDMKRNQLGLETRQVGIQEAGFRLQQDEATRAQAAREVQQRLQQGQLELQRKEADDNRQWRMEQRDIEYRKMEMEERLLRMRLQSDMDLKKLDVADRSNRDHASLLNQMDDNLRQQIRDFQSTNGDLLGLIYNRSNVETEWVDAREKARASGNTEEFNRYNDRLSKLQKYDDLLRRQREVGDAMYDNAVSAGALSKQLGIPAPDSPSAERRWRDYTPEEKQVELQKLGMALLQKPDLDLGPIFEMGISRREVEAAKRMAGVGQEPVEQPASTQRLAPTPSGLRREGGPVLSPVPGPKPPRQPGLNPSFMTVPEPGAIMQKKQDETAARLSQPALSRAPILSGSGSPDSLMAKRNFMLDKSPQKHRIIP